MNEDSQSRVKATLNMIVQSADDSLTPVIAAELGESPEAWRGMFLATQLFIEMIAQQLESLIQLGVADSFDTLGEQEWNKWVQSVVGALFSIRNMCIQMAPEPGG